MEYTCRRTRFRRSPIPCAMSPMFVVIMLETLKLNFQVRGGPKQGSIEIFSPDRPVLWRSRLCGVRSDNTVLVNASVCSNAT